MSARARYCGPLGRGPLCLAGDWLRGPGRAIDLIPRSADGKAVFTHRARVAIELLCRMWNWGPGDEVLAPAYYCGTEIDALRASGLTVTLYRVDAGLRIDVDRIRGAISSSTRAVYVTHYFGFPQDLRDLRVLCNQAGLKLIEDCALSLFSKDGESSLGTVGDAAIFSLAKSLPVPDGGAVVWRGGPASQPALQPAGPARVVRGVLPLLKRSLLRRLSRWGIRPAAFSRPAFSSAISQDMPPSYYFDSQLQGRRASRVSLGMLASLRSDEVVARRRRNFNILRASLENLKDAMIFDDLPEGVCPLAFPLRVSQRDAIVQQLSMECIEAIPWWAGFHNQYPLDAFPEARSLKQSTVAIPVHQDLDEQDMEWIANRVSAALCPGAAAIRHNAHSRDEVSV